MCQFSKWSPSYFFQVLAAHFTAVTRTKISHISWSLLHIHTYTNCYHITQGPLQLSSFHLLRKTNRFTLKLRKKLLIGHWVLSSFFQLYLWVAASCPLPIHNHLLSRGHVMTAEFNLKIPSAEKTMRCIQNLWKNPLNWLWVLIFAIPLFPRSKMNQSSMSKNTTSCFGIVLECFF